MNIRKVTIEDLDTIMKIKDSVFIKNVENFEKSFLIIDYTKKEFQELLLEEEHTFIVAETLEEGIVGFLLGYSDSYEGKAIDILDSNYFYIEQVEVMESCLQDNIKEVLCNHVFRNSKKNTVYLPIVQKPLNVVEHNFCMNLGFTNFDEVLLDEYHVSIWKKDNLLQ